MPPPELGTALLGERLVVRHRTGGIGPSGGPELNDVIGHLRAATDVDLTLERRDGTLVNVRRVDVVTWKVVPPQRD
jgi:hypothetical protein